ncbi:hypothetical protein [uncultured Thiodictyon sp.]|jgi:hypothetical protein|uniref:hypothetical protein n=1 Tax=uncultured Thiodictyon sp. TaxID=1846217 RepID=UPI0025E49FCC|nr:hypothetical protein [uncultured Thiodictyon sp.]
MTTETELRLQGMSALISAMGLIEAERFVAAINREKFDYTQWRKQGLPDLSIDEIAARANTLSASLNVNPTP